MAVVSIDGLCKQYSAGHDYAVRDVSLSVADGEFMVLLGPSGCGKTSVLRMIAGLEPITAGTIAIDGRIVNAVPAKDRDIAMVFQSYALYPHMTVRDNLAFGLRRRNVPSLEITQRVDAVADRLGLTPFLRRKPHALSGGQRQRVALGRAIIRAPKVFLFDEPLSNLDAALRVGTRAEIARQQREIGTTTIYVTHDQAEAMTLGDRIVVMSKGRIEQVGHARDIYFKPANRFVAEFIGTMNRLPAEAAGGLLRVNGGAPLSWSGPDGPVEILFRPEDATLCAPADGQISGTVRANLFLGDRTRLVIDGEGCEIVVETTARREFAHGAVVGLRLDPSHILAL